MWYDSLPKNSLTNWEATLVNLSVVDAVKMRYVEYYAHILLRGNNPNSSQNIDYQKKIKKAIEIYNAELLIADPSARPLGIFFDRLLQFALTNLLGSFPVEYFVSLALAFTLNQDPSTSIRISCHSYVETFNSVLDLIHQHYASIDINFPLPQIEPFVRQSWPATISVNPQIRCEESSVKIYYMTTPVPIYYTPTPLIQNLINSRPRTRESEESIDNRRADARNRDV